MASSGEVTRLLAEIRKGNRVAQERLIPLVYGELHRLAAGYMRKERPDHTLQPTALVNEAYIKLIPQRVSWQNRSHFLGIAAQQMRRILVDHARKQMAAKRGGAGRNLQLREPFVMARERPGELLAVHEALDRLSQDYRQASRVVELRFFGGHTEQETAQMLGVSVETVKRLWKFAKAWLNRALRAEGRS